MEVGDVVGDCVGDGCGLVVGVGEEIGLVGGG